jgi:DNA-binding NarL/FixJ family response regulator
MSDLTPIVAQQQLRVLLADDHRMVLGMFSMFLAETANMVVTTAEDYDSAEQILRQDGPFDVVLLDLNMPGMNGVMGLRRAIRLNDGKPVAIITGNPSPRMSEEIMNTGSAGIILKTTHVRSLANAIRFMHSGERYLPMELMRGQSDASRTGKNGDLTDKEARVLHLLGEGKTNKEIALDLQLAEPTIKMHVTSICRKLDAQNRTHAVIIARDMGLL